MTPEQQAAYVFAQSVSALIEAIGMHNHNLLVASERRPIRYGMEDFEGLAEKYGIHSNAVIGFFQLQ